MRGRQNYVTVEAIKVNARVLEVEAAGDGISFLTQANAQPFACKIHKVRGGQYHPQISRPSNRRYEGLKLLKSGALSAKRPGQELNTAICDPRAVPSRGYTGTKPPL